LSRKHRTDFNDLVVESVEETISEVLGRRVTPAFWHHYQAFLGISRDEMPYRLETLFASLKGMLGVGGDTLGRMIVRKLYAKTNVPLDLKPDRTLLEYVEELKAILAQDIMGSPDVQPPTG
jgi:hypothetical protein